MGMRMGMGKGMVIVKGVVIVMVVEMGKGMAMGWDGDGPHRNWFSLHFISNGVILVHGLPDTVIVPIRVQQYFLISAVFRGTQRRNRLRSNIQLLVNESWMTSNTKWCTETKHVALLILRCWNQHIHIASGGA